MSDKADDLDYQHLDNGIHEFTFNSRSNAAVDLLFQHISDIVRQHKGKERVLYLLNSNGNEPSIFYLSASQNRWKKDHPNPPVSSTAVLHNSATFINFLSSAFTRVGTKYDQTRFFKLNQREEAIAWLLETQQDDKL